MPKLTLHFYGGAGSVTGSNFGVSTAEGDQLLVDCGFSQGSRVAEESNRAPFAFDPKTIKALFVTHAHIDHIGRIPLLVKQGFRGTIYSTPPTRELAELMLTDSLGVLSKEAARDGAELIYHAEDVARSMALWQELPYHEPAEVGAVQVILRNSGHILGSALVELHYQGKTLLFTGDLGNPDAPLLKNAEQAKSVNYLVMESVYGDRVHEHKEERRARLEDVIEETMRVGGTLMIPAFSLERTQELLYEIESMVEHSRIPLVPVFLDSPLAIKVTALYQKYREYLNSEAQGASPDGIFHFPQLIRTDTTADSKRIYEAAPRKIIIAGSGMSNGGRILHHEKRYLPDEKSTLLLIGYQAPGSLGRVLQDGAREVTIMGERIPVRARVVTISGYSAHADRDDLMSFVTPMTDSLERVFVVLGEPKAELFMVQRLRDYLGVNAEAPEEGSSVELAF